jgi:hypothetical protein
MNTSASRFLPLTNASTLRSIMGLTKKGAKNKVENVQKGLTYQWIARSFVPVRS